MRPIALVRYVSVSPFLPSPIWDIRMSFSPCGKKEPCVHFCCLLLCVSFEALTEQLMSLRKGTGSGLLSYWRKSKSHFWSSWKMENYACICYVVLNQTLGKAMVTHAVHERLNAVLLIGWIVLLCKNCYYTVCETNHAAGEKLNRLTERSLVNSNTRCIAVIRDSGGHSPFYGRSTAGMKYFSGKWHPSGKSPWRLLLCCLYMKERREWGGHRKTITLFLSDHVTNLTNLIWCDNSCL